MKINKTHHVTMRGVVKKNPLRFDKKGNLTAASELQYAKHFFMQNPIHQNDLEYYSGKKHNSYENKTGPHGINSKIWKKAFAWAVKTKNLNIMASNYPTAASTTPIPKELLRFVR